jgi:hypothetical protein
MVEQNLGALSEKHNKLIAILELIRIEQYLPSRRFEPGRPRKDRQAMARAFIAKVIFKIAFTKDLIEFLKIDSQLRVICGWDRVSDIPSEAKFSRVFCEFAKTSFADKVHQSLIKEIYKDEIIGHVTRDSTPIEAREKHLKKTEGSPYKKRKATGKKKKKRGELNRRERQLQQPDVNKMINELPTSCDKGMKKSAQGYTMIWKGYKLHVAIADHCIPLAVVVTSASLNDCEAAIPLGAKCHTLVRNFYDLMDAAYDHTEIKEHSRSLGHIPIIDKCPTGISEKIEKEAEKKRLKILGFQTAEQIRYKNRLPSERFNALYKDYYGGRTIRYRGHLKVMSEVMFGVLALTGSLLINLVQ